MKIHVTRAHLDLARGIIDTVVYGDPDAEDSQDSIYSFMSCTYVYSFMALTSFCSRHRYDYWKGEASPLKKKYSSCESFEQLMAGPLKEMKKALKELASQSEIKPLHEGEPKLWRKLNELIKGYRDYFIHPNPENFHSHLEEVGRLEWGLPSETATGIIRYFYKEKGAPIPNWLDKARLKCRGFDYVVT